MASNIVEWGFFLKGDAWAKMNDLNEKTESLMDKARRATKVVANIGTAFFGFQSIINVIGNAAAKFKEFTDANQAQQEAEAKLAQVMRNTMGATANQVDRIKQLAAAQQQLGVIGDEVQLSGAQELATYLEKTESLEKLMPVMNDMLAQQYGLNATQEQATQIASMMGKVMEGQTGALSRYGYKFDEAQEKILKYGTEAEKTATLAEVISQSVGGMNEALAQTPEGQLKQASNNMGDIRERIGAIIVHLEAKLVPAINTTLNIVNSLITGAEQLIGFVEGHLPAVLGISGMLGVTIMAKKIQVELGKTSIASLLTGGAFKTMGAMGKAACRSISTAIVSIPIVGWIAAGIGLVIELVRQLWNRCEGFRAVVMGVWEVLKAVGMKIWEGIKAYYTFIWNLVKTIVNAYISVYKWIWGRIMDLVNNVKAIFSKVGAWFKEVMRPVWDWFSNLWEHVRKIIDNIIDWLAEVFNPIIDLWNKLTGKVVEKFQTGAQKGRDSFAADHADDGKGGVMDGLIGAVNGTNPGNDGLVKPAGQTAQATATGGTRNTEIHINLGSMVENMIFNGGVGENRADIERQIAEVMSRVLGMAEATAG